MNQMKGSIYVDMDGVLVNFLEGVKRETGKPWDAAKTEEERNKRNRAVFEGGKDWWANLRPTDDFYHLWNFVRIFNPHILTAVPHGDGKNPPTDTSMKYAKEGKWEWNLKYTKVPHNHFHCVLREHKANYATSEENGVIVSNVLVDDLQQNIDEWVKNRGIGILHKNAVDTIRKLESLGYHNIGLVA